MMTLEEIAYKIGGVVEGRGDIPIKGISSIHEAGEGEIAVLTNPAYRKNLAGSRAAALILGDETDRSDLGGRNLVIVKNPSRAYLAVAYLFYKPEERIAGVHPQACVSESAAIGEDVGIGAFACVERDAVIGSRVVIHPYVYVGEGVTIGEGSTIYPHVTLYPNTRIGKGVVIHAGTVIGSHGFGYMWDGQSHVKVPQFGGVEIGDDVEIGANSAIDRATLGTTRIGNGVRIDNLVQVAHNVSIGDYSILVSQVGVAGSATIGKHVVLAGQAGVRDHATVGDFVQAGGRTGITGDVPANSLIMGTPHMPHKEWARLQGYLRRLPKLFSAVKNMEKKLHLEDSDGRDK